MRVRERFKTDGKTRPAARAGGGPLAATRRGRHRESRRQAGDANYRPAIRRRGRGDRNDPLAEAKEEARRAYRETYDKFRKISEAVLESEPIPLGHRQTIRRYFESIRPRETKAPSAAPSAAPGQ